MTWTKLPDNFSEDPKIVAAGHLAELAHVRGLIYSNRNLTDGYIPTGIVPSLCRGFERQANKVIAKLVDSHLWEPVQSAGYHITNFHPDQPTRAEVEARRAVRQEAGRLGGIHYGVARRSK